MVFTLPYKKGMPSVKRLALDDKMSWRFLILIKSTNGLSIDLWETSMFRNWMYKGPALNFRN